MPQGSGNGRKIKGGPGGDTQGPVAIGGAGGDVDFHEAPLPNQSGEPQGCFLVDAV
ncbi:hypothetical protein BS47DRAFT_1349894 [Hydnum rufescens UP504]|uniref:Uncharacterized protein n=1 Tax=Hydnum rufescens UP504 TaxID=1448309 RepID=A0A9P6DRY9_9AGAM|nr:hypothetical protein BS47DRAFT_1349894 [Hydnum rufescens UP504]